MKILKYVSLCAMSLATVTVFWYPQAAAAETKLFRVRFVASSFAYRTDSYQNSPLGVISGRAGFDAVWETRVDASVDFPTSFPKPTVRNAKGHVTYTTKNFLISGACDSELTLNPDEAYYPSVNVYAYGKTKFAVKLLAPHTVGGMLISSTASPCNGPYGIHFATIPETFLPAGPLPSDPSNPGMRPEPYTFAAFEVNLKKPDTKINFSYQQDVNLDGGKEKAKMVWFGFVQIEVDPARNDRLPPAIDPYTLNGYSAPNPSDPPANPPAPGSSGSGSKAEIGSWLNTNIVQQIQDALTNIRTALSGQQVRILSAGIENYDTATGVLTLTGVSASPAAGKLTIKTIIGKGAPAKKVLKGAAIESGSTPTLMLTLPQNLRKAFTKKGKSKVQVITEFKPSGGKLVTKRGSVTLQ